MLSNLISMQVGPPHAMDDQGDTVRGTGTWTSSIAKSAVYGRRSLSWNGLDGDRQADLVNHGGADKAVCCYAWEHYAHWKAALDRPEMEPGAFGENFTLLGLTEDEACVGDVFAVGTARVEISQPRVPCWKLAKRWATENLPQMVLEEGYTGWYVRVIEEGIVGAGEVFELLERPYPKITVQYANLVMHSDRSNAQAAAELAACPALAESWRSVLARRSAH